jgi:formylglycine-generating enzyme required for sulfatase activity
VRTGRSVVALSFTLALVAATGCSVVGSEESGDSPDGQGRACAAGDPGCTNSSGAAAPRADDGKKNGEETDVDCGGAKGPRCADGKACKGDGDCASDVCKGGTCQAPKPDDGKKNGDETDIDCGGTKTGAAKCDTSKACKAHSDCASDGCGYDKKCAVARSCAGHFGGDTCGEGEVGDPGAKHESCCTAAPVPALPGAPLVDKYIVTAGRFRQFVDRTKGDIRGYAATLQADPNWNQAWNELLPTNVDETNSLLGPEGHGNRAGCDLGASQGRTYWMSDAENQALGEPGGHLFSKDVLDQKALNCVEFFMLQAFCIWDGGRLATSAELRAAWQADENRVFPWGNDADESRVVHKNNYSFPEVYDKGNWVYIAAPGRRPAGNGKYGHADLAGLVFEWESDGAPGSSNFPLINAGSWEEHPIGENAAQVDPQPGTRAYWAFGGRCARPAK